MVYEYQERKRHMLRFSKVQDPSHQIASVRFAEKKQIEILFRMICYERKTLFRLKKQAKKDEL